MFSGFRTTPMSIEGSMSLATFSRRMNPSFTACFNISLYLTQCMLYIDAANAGVSGDMFIAGLLDLGADPEKIDLALKPIAGVLGEFEIIIKKVRRGVYSSTYYRFEFVDRQITYDECRDAIQKAALSQPARGFALSCFETLTDAESKVHGVDKQSLHLHDAADTISDFVAVSALLDDLSLLDTVVQSSSVNTGMGFFTFHNQRSTLPAP
ncbi:MAG TPA: DUF111 family protein, partial [Euryarchaeota archaeon]|nr:DUF111 family protein [Euryarchaeota archaeon]